MVLDHAENLGVIARIDAGDESLLETKAGKYAVRALDYRVSLVEALNADTDDLLNSFNAAGLKAVKVNQGLGEGLAFADYGIDDRFRRTVWDQVVANAEEHNEAGRATGGAEGAGCGALLCPFRPEAGLKDRSGTGGQSLQVRHGRKHGFPHGAGDRLSKQFLGKMPGNEPSRNRVTTGWNYNAAGYAAVWAEENTREALFAAMRRKEVYASTGPRITVRFFGGWDYSTADATRPDLARIGYAKGVPMGGDLTEAPKGEAPSFLIRAVRDPDGANLDRVQVIKGWREEDGELHEAIYDVALSDGRTENAKGEVEAVGSTVDVADASYTNSIGDPELAVVWTDPDFDRDEPAFYYLRVLEIPTARWTAYDAKFYGLKDLPDEIPMVTQVRAYSSPIWYRPM